MIRVLIADDHLAVRESVRALLASEAEISIVGEAGDGSTALSLARSLRPDIVVLDDAMPGLGSIEVAREVVAQLPGTAVVFNARDPLLRDVALAAGATAFVPKDAPSSELLRALRASIEGAAARQLLTASRPESRRVVELLLGSRLMTPEQVQEALTKCVTGESVAMAAVRLGLIGQPELADVLARASETPLVSLAPYPEIGAAIDPTEARLSSERLVDPVEREAARLLPLDIARTLMVVITAADRGHGVIAMADPLDEAAFAEAERRAKLRLTRVTATADEIQDTLDRAWNGGGDPNVIWTGRFLSKLYAGAVLAAALLIGLGLFTLLVRDALAPRFAFSLFALLCGLVFFVYALKYYVTIASVILITLFGDPAKFQGRHTNGNGNGHSNGNGNGHSNNGNGLHKEGYRTLRGEVLTEAGSVLVDDPWARMGEIRLPPDRQPFVSIHLALYNEGRVVDRLLEACTSFDYENYEVIVADDSTDETVEKLKRWSDHPRVRVIHRTSRKGFKGGALQEALRRMNPKTEYVMVFDADFVPPADAIWHFLDYFGRLTKKNGNGHNGNGHTKNGNGAPTNGDRLAVVQGYQWHMLNASENWVTKGVRAEFSGSYVMERAGQELFGAMKMISGSVYMIRADILRKLGWSTSITEDWELTIRLYLAGYKVLYTPYIQAPAECVSEVRRLVKQRMRWAEGHTYNVRKYFWPVLRSPNLTWQEKLEFVYYAPYYLQSVLFTVATLSWIIGVLILGQKLPMWGEAFGWSLVVSNALALPLMNLTGVLLEGSLKRDALGLLSFIGLSWILVPFQAYASLKALFERKEGGWVRTPKSGVVTETLERFRLARLMPWELPRRKRGQAKTSAATKYVPAAVVVVVAAGIITIGALSIRAAATSGAVAETDFAIPAILGTAIPLFVLALGWLRLRRRTTAIVLAFALGLGTNVIYLANAVPAAAVTDNSSVFTLARTKTFVPTNYDMNQNYTPSGASTTCSAAGTICTHFSDQFTTGQTLNAGTASADLYLSSAVPTITFRAGGATFYDGNLCIPTWPGNSGSVVKGDVMIAACAFRGGSAVSITPPDASWIPLTRIDNGTTISLATFYHVVATSYETSATGNVQFTLGSSQKNASAIFSYAGVDNTNPIDVHNGQATSTGTSHTALGVTTTSANDLLITFHAVAGSTGNINQWTPPAAMSERAEGSIATGSNGSNASLEGNELLLGAAGATGNQTATSVFSGLGVTKTIALRPATTCTVTATVKKVNPIWLRGATTKTVNSGTSVVVDVPAGTQQNDVMYVYLAFSPIGASITTPTGWTPGSSSGATGIQVYTYRRVASASEPANYTWTFNITTNIAAWAGSYVGVDTTTPTDLTSQTSDTGTPTTHTTATRLPALEDEMIVLGVAISGNVTYTSVSGMTPEGNPIAGTSTFASLGMFDGIQGARTYINRTTTSSAGGAADMVMLTLRPATPATTLGSGSVTINLPSGTALASTGSFSTASTTFATGDRLELDLVASSACAGSLSYDGASEPSKLTIATVVPEGVAGLLLLAPALPFAARWWKRRRP